MNKPKINQFHLSKVKHKDGSLEFSAKVEKSDGAETFMVDINENAPVQPHPALTGKLEEIKPFLAEIHGFLTVQKLMQNPDFKANKGQTELMQKAVDAILDDITVTGIAISGNDKNEGFIITGTYQGMAINSRRLKFTSTKYGWEEDMRRIVDELIEEVYLFAYEGKKAQLEIFGGNSEEVEMGEMALAK